MRYCLKLRTSICVLVWIVMVSKTGFGQTSQNVGHSTKSSVKAPNNKEISEDLDVFSTILHENLQTIFALPKGTGKKNANTKTDQPNATYLPGYGVAIIVKTPPVYEKKLDRNKNLSKPTRWELTASRLRGDNTAIDAEEHMANRWTGNCTVCHQISDDDFSFFAGFDRNAAHAGHIQTRKALTELMVQTLAQVGHNIRGLNANDRISITAITKTMPPGSSHYFNAHSNTDYFLSNLRHSEETNTHKLSGDLLYKQGNIDESLAAYKKALQNSPDNFGILAQILRIYQRQNNPEEVQRWKSQMIDLIGKIEATSTSSDEFLRRAYLDLTGLPPTKKELENLRQKKDSTQELVDWILSSHAKPRSPQRDAWNQAYHNWHNLNRPKPTTSTQDKTRIIVSATKKDLDIISSRGLSLDEYRDRILIQVWESK